MYARGAGCQARKLPLSSASLKRMVRVGCVRFRSRGQWTEAVNVFLLMEQRSLAETMERNRG
jgi:hypothetical protein